MQELGLDQLNFYLEKESAETDVIKDCARKLPIFRECPRGKRHPPVHARKDYKALDTPTN